MSDEEPKPQDPKITELGNQLEEANKQIESLKGELVEFAEKYEQAMKQADQDKAELREDLKKLSQAKGVSLKPNKGCYSDSKTRRKLAAEKAEKEAKKAKS